MESTEVCLLLLSWYQQKTEKPKCPLLGVANHRPLGKLSAVSSYSDVSLLVVLKCSVMEQSTGVWKEARLKLEFKPCEARKQEP